ncbi:hypothetical protein BAC2_03069 [uncultured bacterium]|nr:hypothetical protein BAC2_03069 [uncultured bacterium]
MQQAEKALSCVYHQNLIIPLNPEMAIKTRRLYPG